MSTENVQQTVQDSTQKTSDNTSNNVSSNSVDAVPLTFKKFVGYVKWFSPSKGYGFISSLNNSQDYFVHHSNIKPCISDYCTLFKGEYVEFDVISENNKNFAQNVTGLLGNKLMCDQSFNTDRRPKPNTQNFQN